jgi:hypothetical protein
MIQTGFESRIKIQDIISNQLPEFVLDESPKAVDFLKQYYISQEYQGGPIDIAENLDQYLKVDNLIPEVIVDSFVTTEDITSNDTVISVTSTKGFPNKYGLLKIDDEIITYTGLTSNTFTGCVRGFSGVTNYHHDLNNEELVFTQSDAAEHSSGSSIQNLSSLFLKEFYNKIKYTFTPGFENREFDSQVNVGNFIKEARSFYESKGTNESFRILFNVLYGETPKVINLEDYLLKPSDAEFLRREIVVAEAISGDPLKLIGQTLFKSDDATTKASISSIEAFTRRNIQYFKISLFVGYNENNSIEGTFKITPNTKCLEDVDINSPIISVDSTIGFDSSGTIRSGNNTISYTDKNINQFLNCSGITEKILSTSNVFSSTETYFGYEDGDLSKKVELRLTGVLRDFEQKSKFISAEEGQILTVKNLGELIKNPESNKTYKEIFANSWIYNTSVSIQIESFDGSSVTLKTDIDRSHFKKGDEVEIVDITTNTVTYPTETSDRPYVSDDIQFGSKTVLLDGFDLTGIIIGNADNYVLRRKINKASSSSVSFEHGNGSLISDVQNVYIDNDDFAYVASNSLPSYDEEEGNFYTYELTQKLNQSTLSSSLGQLTDLSTEDISADYYTSILFDDPVPFVTGDKIFYQPLQKSLVGLDTGSYYVRVSDTNPKSIKLYTSASFVNSDTNALQFSSSVTPLETHLFTLETQKSRVLGSSNILKKFSLDLVKGGSNQETIPGSTGMLINGVEIFNYKSQDKVYYGPLQSVSVLNGGSNFDVINPPKIEISPSAGTTALVHPVVTGSITNIFVDTQDFDVNQVLSVNVTGLNISGGSFQPILTKRRRELLFDARPTTSGGGISTTTSQLTFISNHNLSNGEEIIYGNNGNDDITIGFGSSSLINGASYYAKVDNNTTIQLFPTFEDYQSSTNVIGFSTESLSGTHQFLVGSEKNTISEIKILDGGSLTNRKLLVDSSKVSVSENSINFENHGFSNGDIVEYSSDGSTISGLSTTNQYYILTSDTNSFRLCDAGIGGTVTSNFEQEKYEKLLSSGSGLQEFKYPDIEVTVEFTTVGVTSVTEVNTVKATPEVKGYISDIYLYNSGTGYGSSIINNELKPIFTIKNGRSGQVEPIILNGKIVDLNLQFNGYDYFSVPDLEIVDPTGSGTGGKLRASISNGKISEVTIINPGIGYSTSTVVNVVSSGSNAIFDSTIRSLTINEVEKLTPNQYQIYKDVNDKLQYFVSGYFENIRTSFQEENTELSGIIGWAYDGNPIYGSYAISDIEDLNSSIKTLKSSYTKDSSNIFDRPSELDFPLGFFVEDYKYDSSNGDLDEHNGRFSKTVDFPEGIYAYYATIDSVTANPQFPYFIGNTYRSNILEENYTLNQDFDFNNSSLVRNTFPYKISEQFADNDFIVETNEIKRQKIKIKSVSEGSISGFDIINSGDNYKVGDSLTFDNEGTDGGGLQASISSIEGKTINDITTNLETYNNSIFVWGKDKVEVYIDPSHQLSSGDFVIISGFSTSILSELNNSYRITVPVTDNIGLTTEIQASGESLEIYVTNVLSSILPGTNIGIGTETLEVLNVFSNKNILRVKRGIPGISHTTGEQISIKPNKFTLNVDLDYFESKFDDKVYFNPNESIGVGTITGVGNEISFSLGDETITRNIPTQRIYLENHPFATNQLVDFNVNGNGTISISNTPTSTPYDLPSSVYVVNKSPNTIGIKTTISGDEIFFRTNGDNVDDYYFESTFKQELANVKKIVSTVSVSTSHGLSDGDTISLTVKPNLSVGIGTSTAVRVLYKSEIENIVVNPIGFNSTGVSTTTNEITITDHGLVTGDKVFYEDDTFEYLFDTNDQIDTTAQDGTAESVFFKPDGTKMYVVGRSADEVNEYELSTPWSPSTATFTNVLDVTTEDTNPTGIYIRDDGLKFWICGYTNDRIHQYSMSTAWDISTASYDNVSLLVGSGNSLGFTQSTPQGIYFKYDGTVLYIIGASGDFIHQLDLSTAWDITTASYSGNTTGRLDINPPDASPSDIQINSSGTIVYWVGVSADSLYIYELSTPWDITTGVEIDRFAFTNPYGVYVSPDEENFYIVSSGNDIVKRYRRPSPLTESEYFIYKVDENTIKFCDTLKNANSNPPVVVSFASTGSSSQSISLINPQIQTVKNNNLVFDLSDSSLSGYEFKIYYDQEFNNDFVSTGSTTSFNISGVGTVGVTSTASLTINYSNNIPQKLYYNLEKSGYISTSDKDVKNYSEIFYADSVYTNSYSIFDVGVTTFRINVSENPEKLSYSSSESDELKYTTTSLSAQGPVNKIKIDSKGLGYKKLPNLTGSNSSNGENLYVIPKTNDIGIINQVRIINQGFEYSSDRTLQPEAFISPSIVLSDSNTIKDITVINGGSGYINAPNIVIVNNDTREVINTGILSPVLLGNSISEVVILNQPKGVSDESAELFAVNNTNGISIKQVESSSTGIFTCIITTPSGGFSQEPFNNGDEVFIEGIQKYGSSGDGFNSSDYGYKFFVVDNYDNGGGTGDARVTIDISNLTSNTGIAKTIQDSAGTIVNKNNYPSFELTLSPSFFDIGEKIISNGIERDLEVVGYDDAVSIKVFGSYDLSVGEIITGKTTGNIATIESLTSYEGKFTVDYSSRKDEGWNNETGKLNEDYQLLPDNDYYQNLSYSIKSFQQWKDIRTPVNSLVHTAGLKNFSDTQIVSDSEGKIGISSFTNETTVIKDIIDTKRVDTIYNFDFVTDVDVVDNTSRFLKLNTKKLSNYTQIGSNIVLKIDNISDQFSNFNSDPNEYKNLFKINTNETYSDYLFKFRDINGTEIQLTSIKIINDNISNNSFILENVSLSNNENDETYADFSIENDEFGDVYLRFTPKDPFDTEYDLKYIEKKVLAGVGLGTTSIGFVDIVSSVSGVSSSSTSTIAQFSSSDISSLYVKSNVIQENTNDINFVELFVTHDGTNTNIAEYYFDNTPLERSNNVVGLFTAFINAGTLSLEFINDTSYTVDVKSRIVGFGNTSVGIGTYRFKLNGQPEGNERSTIYQSNYSSTSSGLSTSIITLDKSKFDSINALVEVGIGNTKSLHNIILIQDQSNIYTQQSQFLSIGDNLGIGTFGGEYTGPDKFELKFYPDSNSNIKISSFNECLYTAVDTINNYPDLVIENSIDSVGYFQYFAINGDRINKVDFVLRTDGIPIFGKKFNPNDTNVLNPATGTFSIQDHFFSNGEELIYTPGSTFIGVGASSLVYDNGVGTGSLPSSVFVVNKTNDTFQISTTRSGTPVTFTSLGGGNNHLFEMSKSNEKAIINIDNLTQYPLIYTKVQTSLSGNGGSISSSDEIFSLSGISTLNPSDILKINDEYMEVINVGFGTLNTGPITNTGTEKLVQVSRGFVGSSATSHTDSDIVDVYKGSYNIVGDKIYFTKAPRGNTSIIRTENNLLFETSDFNGRVFLRSDYTTNRVYDDISNEFTGIGRTFTLTVGGANTTGIGSIGDNGVVFINGIFQTPTTDNNPNNNFSILEDGSKTDIIFSGIRTDPGDPNSVLAVENDINQNQVPRGGIIVSLGSSGGLGYAPLAGAAVSAVVSTGSITDLSINFVGGSYGSGYNGIVSIGVTVFEEGHVGTAANITGVAGIGGTVIFNIVAGGSGYTNPTIIVSEPSYENLEVTGVSRIGVGATTDIGVGLLLDVDVSASTATGIGSTYFEVSNFRIKRNGYSFKKGDVFTPVGLVTDGRLSSPLSRYELTVLDTFSDNFGCWQFGEFDFIDSLKFYQDGERTRFPLLYNGSLLSFEVDEDAEGSIDLSNSLLIFLNGILQEPGVSYNFDGGTSFTFTTAPKEEDNISVFFYRGTKGVDDILVTNIIPSLERGDIVQVFKNNSIPGTVTQDSRVVFDITESDKFETNFYDGSGIDIVNLKPMSWTKQKTDRFVNGEFVYKTRQSIISQIYPTAKVIGDLSTSDTEIFVDDANLFGYADSAPYNFGAILVGENNAEPPNITSTIDGNGSVTSLTIVDGGSGYSGSTVDVKFSAPPVIGVGVGTTATATVTIGSDGVLTTPINITNPGFGYSTAPLTIVERPNSQIEVITTIQDVKGFSGIITGIGVTDNAGQLALKFTLKVDGIFNSSPNILQSGYPILIKNTAVGSGVISVDNSDSEVVAIGTNFLDNIYYVSQVSSNGSIGIVTCNIDSSTSTAGLSTNGLYVGEFSWGRLSTITRSTSPISIGVTGKTVDVGLSTFPSIQRRDDGLRETGAIDEKITS